jgi:hypothetical protein
LFRFPPKILHRGFVDDKGSRIISREVFGEIPSSDHRNVIGGQKIIIHKIRVDIGSRNFAIQHLN